MPNNGEPRVDFERGRDLPGDGISQKCRVGRHGDCTAERCQCHCLHGAIPSLVKALTRCPAQGCSRDEGHKGYHLCSVCHVTLAGVEYDNHECYPPNSEIHVELPSGAVARVDPAIQPTSTIRLKRKDPTDEITFASLTAGLGRRGTSR